MLKLHNSSAVCDEYYRSFGVEDFRMVNVRSVSLFLVAVNFVVLLAALLFTVLIMMSLVFIILLTAHAYIHIYAFICKHIDICLVSALVVCCVGIDDLGIYVLNGAIAVSKLFRGVVYIHIYMDKKCKYIYMHVYVYTFM
jgi:hypothetical protein